MLVRAAISEGSFVGGVVGQPVDREHRASALFRRKTLRIPFRLFDDASAAALTALGGDTLAILA